MAKCVGSIIDWVPSIIDLEDANFIVDDAKVGEDLLNKRLEDTYNLVLDIGNDYVSIKQQSTHDDGYKWDCSQLQDSIIKKLKKLQSEISSVINKICSSNLMPATQHRYFIHYSCGAIEKLQQLLQIVGRLSQLDEKLFLEEQRKPLISEESITVHTLTAIWLATIEIMTSFHKSAQEIFKEQLQSDEYSFIEQLEFSTAGLHHAKVLTMDLIITSWIQFNRLMKYIDLVQGLPFLCPCHGKTFFKLLQLITMAGIDKEILPDLLSTIIDYQCKPSMMTKSARRYDIVPHEPIHSKSDDQQALFYFLVWHLYSLSRIVNDINRPLIANCRNILESSFNITLEQFIPNGKQPNNNINRLSPHQEERFKLLIVMFHHWCEKNPIEKNLILVKDIFSFFDKNWNFLGINYFDKNDFRVESLTIFELFTKIINQISPMYTIDGQAVVANSDKVPTKEEQDLNDTWNKILAKTQPKEPLKTCSTNNTK